ncbi:hypothetical protein [Streptomyces sp. NPDC056600]
MLSQILGLHVTTAERRTISQEATGTATSKRVRTAFTGPGTYK